MHLESHMVGALLGESSKPLGSAMRSLQPGWPATASNLFNPHKQRPCESQFMNVTLDNTYPKSFQIVNLILRTSERKQFASNHLIF